MKVYDGVEVLKLSATTLGRQRTIYPTLLWDEDTVILVDAGFPNMLPEIQSAMEEAGVPFSKLKRVILTHQDVDHIGGLPELLRAGEGKIEVLAHGDEKPYIEGEKPLIKYNPQAIGKMLKSLPIGQQRRVTMFFADPPKANVDTALTDGEELPWCGGIKVIFTPGHTPGHISLYLKKSKTLIAGDALLLVDGHLVPSPPEITADPALAFESLKKLMKLDIETVICYHGGVWRGDIHQVLSLML